MPEITSMFVDYTYCMNCKHLLSTDPDGPCSECLETPTNINSQKPVNYEPNTSQK